MKSRGDIFGWTAAFFSLRNILDHSNATLHVEIRPLRDECFKWFLKMWFDSIDQTHLLGEPSKERRQKKGKKRKRKETKEPHWTYLCHVIQAVEDVLARLLRLDPCLTLVVLWSLWETKSRCFSQIPSRFPSGKELFTFGSLQPLVVDVQQDTLCPQNNPGVTNIR